MLTALIALGLAVTIQNVAEIDSRCKVGTSVAAAPVGGEITKLSEFAKGKTPASMTGVKRVSVAELDCLTQGYGERLLTLSAIELPDVIGLPKSILIVGGGKPALDEFDTQQELVKMQLDRLTKGDRDRPLVVYCHNQSCLLSPNLLIRAQRAGYRNLYWLRGGTSEWREAGKQFGLARLTFEDLDEKTQLVLACDSWSQRQIAQGKLAEDRYGAFMKPHAEAVMKLHSEDTLTAASTFHAALLEEMLRIAERLDGDSKKAGEQLKSSEARYKSQCQQLGGSGDLYR